MSVTPHQDSTFLFTDPVSACGFWFPLEDATAENGTLWFIPGSHKTTPITRRFVRNPEYFIDYELKHPDPTSVDNVPALRFRYEQTETYPAQPHPENDPAFVRVDVKKGSAVLLHGSVIHKSDANLSDKSRFIYAFHVIESDTAYDGAFISYCFVWT